MTENPPVLYSQARPRNEQTIKDAIVFGQLRCGWTQDAAWSAWKEQEALYFESRSPDGDGPVAMPQSPLHNDEARAQCGAGSEPADSHTPPAPVVAEVRRAPLPLEGIRERYRLFETLNRDWLNSQTSQTLPLLIRQDIPNLLAEVARLTAERDKEYDLAEEWKKATYKAEADLEALRTSLRGLEQQWRVRGLLNCPNIQQPASGWTQQQLSARLGGSILLIHADELARLLTTPKEPK